LSKATDVDTDEVRKVADKIKKLLDESTFNDKFGSLNGRRLEAGKFDVAQWLEDRVADRSQGLYQHGLNLHKALTDLAEHLGNIADIFDGADSGHADGAKNQDSALEELNDWVTGVKDDMADLKAKAQQAGDNNYNSGDNAPLTVSTDHPLYKDNGNGQWEITWPGSDYVGQFPKDLSDIIGQANNDGSGTDITGYSGHGSPTGNDAIGKDDPEN
jgi:hypothetical protein